MNTGINPGIYLEYLFRFWQQLTDYTFHIASGCCSWWNTIDNMENVTMISFFNKQGDFMSFRLIDFKRGFDTVDHEIMLRKLDCYGIRGHTNMLFRSYLINERQFTVANAVQSDIGFVKFGVPQGSVLGPLFFLLYINDIYRAVGCNAVRLFADDTSLLSYGINLNDVIIQAK